MASRRSKIVIGDAGAAASKGSLALEIEASELQ